MGKSVNIKVIGKEPDPATGVAPLPLDVNLGFSCDVNRCTSTKLWTVDSILPFQNYFILATVQDPHNVVVSEGYGHGNPDLLEVDDCVSYPNGEYCSTGRICSGGSCVDSGSVVADLSASLTFTNDYVDNTPYPNTRHIYYDAELIESNGISVEINRAKRCFDSISCDFDGAVSPFSIPGLEATRSSWVESKYSPDSVTITYYGKDENENDVEVSFSIDFP